MMVKTGRFGRFLACSSYPACKTTKAVTMGIQCPECKHPFKDSFEQMILYGPLAHELEPDGAD